MWVGAKLFAVNLFRCHLNDKLRYHKNVWNRTSSCHVMPCHAIPYHVTSRHVTSYHIISYHIIYYIISYHITSHHISYHIISYIISYHIISHHITSHHMIWYLNYCIHVWGKAYNVHIHDLIVLQNKAVRIVHGVSPRTNADKLI